VGSQRRGKQPFEGNGIPSENIISCAVAKREYDKEINSEEFDILVLAEIKSAGCDKKRNCLWIMLR
jgi:hypothetical protein